MHLDCPTVPAERTHRELQWPSMVAVPRLGKQQLDITTGLKDIEERTQTGLMVQKQIKEKLIKQKEVMATTLVQDENHEREASLKRLSKIRESYDHDVAEAEKLFVAAEKNR